jgi:glycosyltransferase involved in cell wall biosynthesis
MNDLQELMFPQTAQDPLVGELDRRREPRTRSDLPTCVRPADPSGDKGLSAPHQPTYVLVSPVHNEEKFIGRMIESIASQTVLPGHWIIVDDGSTDSTAEIVKAYAKRYEFIELIRLSKRTNRKPGGESVVQQVLKVVQDYPYDFLARFDADLEFCSDYIEKILGEFSDDKNLGIAGGGLYVEKNGRLVLEKVPYYHVRGGLKMYRRKCLEQIGTLYPCMGWDTIDEVFAWKYSWKTRSFFENRVIHKRPTGEGLSAGEISWQRGRGEYYTWSHPLFVLLKAARVAITGPIRALHFLGGFLECYRKHEERLRDSDFKRIRRKQQLRRLMSAGLLTEPKL